MLLCIEMAIFSVLHLWAFPWKEPYSLKNTNPITAPGSGYSGKPHYEGGPFGLKAYMDAGNPWDIIKSSARGFRWLFVGVKHRREDSSYAPAGAWGTDSGVLGTQGGTGVYYSSTKLGPVGNSGPTSMQRDRHMSRETVDDVSRRQSAERRAESANGSTTYVPSGASASSVGGRWPGQSTGDLADVPPQHYDTAYQGSSNNGGKKAYYGDELPPAPYPTYHGGSSSYPPSPYDETPSANGRGVSPLRGVDESDTAGLLSNAGASGTSDGAGRHPGFRR